MGGRGTNSGQNSTRTIQMAFSPPTITATVQQASAANAQKFSAVDNSPTHQLYNGRQYYEDQNLTIDQQLAVIQYLRADRVPGTQYSMSQNMNWKMVQNAEAGRPLDYGMTANEKFTCQHINAAMHNLGHNVTLTRYDHPNIVNKLLANVGLNGANWENMTESQLKKALVGHRYGEEKYNSTSYNDFKNAPAPSAANNFFTFTDRQVKIVYSAKARAQALMPGNGPGGRLGEVLLSPSFGRKNYYITDLSLSSGNVARKQGSPYGSRNGKRIVLYVDVD